MRRKREWKARAEAYHRAHDKVWDEREDLRKQLAEVTRGLERVKERNRAYREQNLSLDARLSAIREWAESLRYLTKREKEIRDHLLFLLDSPGLGDEEHAAYLRWHNRAESRHREGE